MRIMPDTNVLISLILFPREPLTQMFMYIEAEHTLVVSSVIYDEVMTVAAQKFPGREDVFRRFLDGLNHEYVEIPPDAKHLPLEIRDASDLPVLSGAIFSDVDIFITGDKDFRGLKLEKPMIFTPAQFIRTFCVGQ